MDALLLWGPELDKLGILLVVGLCGATSSLCTSQEAVHPHRQYMDASPFWGVRKLHLISSHLPFLTVLTSSRALVCMDAAQEAAVQTVQVRIL